MAQEMTIDELTARARHVRCLVLETTHRAGMGHTGGSLSEADILTALYFRVLQNIDPADPARPDRDRFILSKGHASVGYYATLAARGYFPLGELENFDELGTSLQAHPDMHKATGVDMSTGSLGQGLSCGIGMALAAQRDGASFRTFVLIGDGESQEGQIWEAALYAGSNALPGIVAIVDRNDVQLSSKTDDAVGLGDLAAKWRAFGWSTHEVDGHDMASLTPALERCREEAAKGPVALIARTIKGKGVSFMEGRFEWHGKAPNDAEFLSAMAEVNA